MQQGSTYPNTNPYQNPAPVGSPAPMPGPAPAPVNQPAVPSAGKPKTGLIIGIIVTILVIVGVTVALILILGNKKDGNKTDENGNSGSSQVVPDNSNQDKKTASTITLGYKGKSFVITTEFGKTVESAAASFDLYKEDENYHDVKISDLKSYLDTESDNPYDDNAEVFILGGTKMDEDVITIAGKIPFAKQGETLAFRNFDLYEVKVDNGYNETETASLDGFEITIGKTTKTELVAKYGEPSRVTELGSGGEAVSFENGSFEITFYMDREDDLILSFLSIEPLI